MTLNIVKLCVGAESVDDVADWRGRTLVERKKRGQSAHMAHTTRMWPRREEELLQGGSLYWVVKGLIQVRQPLAGFEEYFDDEGIRYCTILMEPELILTKPTPKRPFQGWRYLLGKDAPPDLPQGANLENGQIVSDLAELGLL